VTKGYPTKAESKCGSPVSYQADGRISCFAIAVPPKVSVQQSVIANSPSSVGALEALCNLSAQ
jgi:hypothetical protein